MATVCVFCGSSRAIEERYLTLARRVGEELARRGHTLVSGGGRVAMMGEVAAAARAAGGCTVGVIPKPLVAMEIADTEADELVVTADMAERKTVMCDRSDAFLVLPGGIGTLDELFEVWTTFALGVHNKPIVVLDVDGFFEGLFTWVRSLVPLGFVKPAALQSVYRADTVAGAIDLIESMAATGAPGAGEGAASR